MLRYPTTPREVPGIVIAGLGGAGANILQCFGDSGAEHVRLCVISPDERLEQLGGNLQFLQLGAGIGRGMGTGGDPEVGARVAQESAEGLSALLADARLLVMVCGLGGGTGSGAAPVLARMAAEAGLFVVSVLVLPFSFEGRRRREQAERARREIAALSNITLCFENDRMEELLRGRSGVRSAFEEANRLLARAAACVPTLAHSPGLINLGLDELAQAMAGSNARCLFGCGSAHGSDRATAAAQAALNSPLLRPDKELPAIHTAIVHVAGGETMTLTEIRRAMETIHAALPREGRRLFFGAAVKPQLGEDMRISIIAAIDHAGEAAPLCPPEPPMQQEPRQTLFQGELAALLEACPREKPKANPAPRTTRPRPRAAAKRSYNDLRDML